MTHTVDAGSGGRWTVVDRRDVAEAVRRCVVDRARDPAGPPDLALLDVVGAVPGDRLRRCAVSHAVANLVHLATRDLPVPDATAAAALADAHRTSAVAHLRTLVDLDRVAQVLRAADVPWLVFKGPVLAELVHPFPDLRAYSDLDVLVAPERFGVALDALVDAGATLLDRNWTRLTAERRGQLHLTLPSGAVLDLHWHLLNHASVRAHFHLPTAELLGRARVVDLGGPVVPTLDATATLLHLCLHAALDGAARLGWTYDLDQLVRTTTPDWDEVVSGAVAWGARVPLAGILLRTAAWLGTPVPREVVDELVPSGVVRRALRAAAATAPTEDPLRTGIDAVVFRCARDRVPNSVQAAARWSGRKVARTSARRGDVFVPTGDAEARARYLADVTASGSDPTV